MIGLLSMGWWALLGFCIVAGITGNRIHPDVMEIAGWVWVVTSIGTVIAVGMQKLENIHIVPVGVMVVGVVIAVVSNHDPGSGDGMALRVAGLLILGSLFWLAVALGGQDLSQHRAKVREEEKEEARREVREELNNRRQEEAK